jgi:hypothetical protein
MLNSPTAAVLRQRAAHIRVLADQISDERYSGLLLAAAGAYEKGALELDTKRLPPA